MAIRAAEYDVGFNSQAAITAFDQFKTAVKSGNADMDVAFRQLTGAFEQHNNVRRQGTKEVNRWTQFIREERMENRQLGFMVRNTAESVGGLAQAFGAQGVGGAMMRSFAQFDQVKFVLEGIEVAGRGVGGRLGQIAGVLGGIALPAGVAYMAFSAIKEKVTEDEEKIKSLSKEIRALNIELGNIKPAKIAELTNELAKVNDKKPDIGVWTVLLGVVDHTLGTSYALKNVGAEVLGIDKERLTLQKQIRDAIKEQLLNAEGLKRLADEYKLAQATQAENASRLAISEVNLSAEEKGRVSSILAHLALVKDQIIWAQGNLAVGKRQHMTLLDQVVAQTNINQLLAQEVKLRYDLANRSAEDEARGPTVGPSITPGEYGPQYYVDTYKDALEFLRETVKLEALRKQIEARNVPRKLPGVNVPAPVSTDEVLESFREYQNQMLQLGDAAAGAISQGIMRGFESGKFALNDFKDAILQSIAQIAARQAGIAAIAGLAALLSGGSFLPIFGALGGLTFGARPSGGSGDSAGGGSVAPGNNDLNGLKSEIHALGGITRFGGGGETENSAGGKSVAPGNYDLNGLKSEIHALVVSIKDAQRGQKSGNGSLAMMGQEEVAVFVQRGDRILNRRKK